MSNDCNNLMMAAREFLSDEIRIRGLEALACATLDAVGLLRPMSARTVAECLPYQRGLYELWRVLDVAVLRRRYGLLGEFVHQGWAIESPDWLTDYNRINLEVGEALFDVFAMHSHGTVELDGETCASGHEAAYWLGRSIGWAFRLGLGVVQEPAAFGEVVTISRGRIKSRRITAREASAKLRQLAARMTVAQQSKADAMVRLEAASMIRAVRQQANTAGLLGAIPAEGGRADAERSPMSVGAWLMPPVSKSELRKRLRLPTIAKVESLLKPYGLTNFPPENRQSWTVRLDNMPASLRAQTTGEMLKTASATKLPQKLAGTRRKCG